MSETNNRLGILLMMLSTIIFSIQDGLSRHLAGEYNAYMVVMVRYWFFAAFVVFLAARAPGGIRATAKTNQLGLQIFRGVLLVAEITLAVYGFTILGLVNSQAIFICYPLLIAALCGPVLGEKVGWRRWCAIGTGLIGVMIILRPDGGVFDPYALIPLLTALMFAVYGLLTRYVARQDTAQTSFFWTGVAGSAAMTCVGIWFWEPMHGMDILWMACLCLTGVAGHGLLIKCYSVAEASTVQPFAYFHLIWSALVGLSVFGEIIHLNIVVGSAIIIGAGLFTLWREQLKARTG